MAVSLLPICKRCRLAITTPDRLTLHRDDEQGSTLRVHLCKSCSKSLEAWLDPPESVRAGWADRRLGTQS